MPEGDTVARTAARLDRALRGTRLTRAELRWPGLSTIDLTGDTTTEVVAIGKHLLHRLSTGRTLHTHLKMEGSWRVVEATKLAGWERNDEVRVLLATDRAGAVGLRLGTVDLIVTDRESDLVGHLGPDILAADFDAAQATDSVLADPRPVAQALLDQRHLAGVGTLWAAEGLFVEGLHPWKPAAALGRPAIEKLLWRTRRMMQYAVRTGNQGGVAALTGLPSRRSGGTFTHARSGRPCRRCGTPIRVAAVGAAPRDRVLFYCPGCQGGLAAGDDGRRQAPLGARGREQR